MTKPVMAVVNPPKVMKFRCVYCDGMKDDDDDQEVRSVVVSEDGLFLHVRLTDGRDRTYVIGNLAKWEIA